MTKVIEIPGYDTEELYLHHFKVGKRRTEGIVVVNRAVRKGNKVSVKVYKLIHKEQVVVKG
jgi:hypothetical protein